MQKIPYKIETTPTKTLQYIDGYWVDRRFNNRWTADGLSKREAQRMRDSLIDCNNCTDCVCCSYCTSCQSCWHCHNCKDQIGKEYEHDL